MGGEPDRNAFVELHNVVVAADSLGTFGPDDRDRISRQRGVDLETRFADDRRALYGSVLDALLARGPLDADGRAVAAHVADTLALSPAAVRRVHERAFGAAVRRAVDDDDLAVEERLMLGELGRALGLEADAALAEAARERLFALVMRALTDDVASPDERAEVDAVAAGLGVEVPAELEGALEAAARRWDAREGARPRTTPRPDDRERLASRGWWAAVLPSEFVGWAGYEAVRSGTTQTLVLPTSVLDPVTWVGEVTVTGRHLGLDADDAPPTLLDLADVVQTLRFKNGAVVRFGTGQKTFVDTGDHQDPFYRALYEAVQGARGRPSGRDLPAPTGTPARLADDPGAPPFRFAGSWRKLYDADLDAAAARARQERYQDVMGVLIQNAAEERLGPDSSGYATLDAERLLLHSQRGGLHAEIPLRTIGAVREAYGAVWISRPDSHDWYLSFLFNADRFVYDLRRATNL